MNLLALLVGILGIGTNNILMVNQTGIKIVRIEIDSRRFEEINGKVDQIIISVTPEKHDMLVVFKGGGDVHWPAFNFKNIHEVIFYRTHEYEIRAHSK